MFAAALLMAAPEASSTDPRMVPELPDWEYAGAAADRKTQKARVLFIATVSAVLAAFG